ncbi:MAG: phosphopantetheine adenylyltransferase [Methanocellales archaeon]|nr:phosphopantetheine adenylyltransferase [Methanocellales archaeon]
MEKKRVAVGGTFEPLHDGHRAILKKAYELGEVYIGLTSDAMADHRYREVLPYERRKKALEQYIHREFGSIPNIQKLYDPHGPTIEEHFDYIVISPDTYPVAMEINRIRERKGLRPIEIVKIDFVLAQDGKPISSTRIKNGEIDEHGVLI